MEIYETFVTEPDRLPEAIRKIRNEGMPSRFNQEFLKHLGFEKPNSILYVSLFKKLGLIDEEELPNQPDYSIFVGSEQQARLIVARQMVNFTYKSVFAEDKTAYQLPEKEIYNLFRRLMGPEKSKTIVRMVADTFCALAAYADWKKFNHDHQTNKNMEYNSTTVNGNGSIEEAKTPHEEFILELMNDCSEHDYPSKSPATDNQAREHDNQSFAHEEPMGKNDISSESQPDNDKPNRPSASLQQSKQIATSVKNTGKNHNVFLGTALVRRAELLTQLNRLDEAIRAYDDIIAHSDKGTCPIDEEKVSNAYYEKASLLEKMNHYEEALKTYDLFIKRYGRN